MLGIGCAASDLDTAMNATVDAITKAKVLTIWNCRLFIDPSLVPQAKTNGDTKATLLIFICIFLLEKFRENTSPGTPCEKRSPKP
jgi:hypothetical protein